MIQLVSAIVNGAMLGGIFALVCLGLVLVFRATDTFSFSHGQMMLLPAYIVGISQIGGGSPGWIILIAVLIAAAVGALFYLLVLQRMTGQPAFLRIVATFGLAAILDGVMGILFRGAQVQVVLPFMPNGTVELAGVQVGLPSVFVAGSTLLIAAVTTIVVRFTHLGTLIRAAGQDPLLAAQSGIPVRWLFLGSWAAAGVLAAAAGLGYGSVAVVNPSLVVLGISALPAMVLGGLDSIEGAVVGGIIVGQVQSFVATYMGGQYVNVVTYSLLLVFLLLRPQGLFGTRQIVRA